MAVDLSTKFGTGLTPEAFVAGMERNKEAFQNWYDQFVWNDEEDREFFESLSFRDDIRCLIVAAEWCGDVVKNVPAVFRILEPTAIPTEVLIIEQNYDVIDEFLTLGGRSIPKVIFTDTGGHLLGHWGPRPESVQVHMRAFKAANPDREAADYADNLKATYAKMGEAYGEGVGYQQLIINELRELLSGV